MDSEYSARRRRRRELGLAVRPDKSTSVLAVDAMLAGSPGHSLAQWLAEEFNHNFDAYDSAIDSAYNASHIGGSHYHHLVDQQHDIVGAYRAVEGVAPDDTFLEESLQVFEHLARDLCSVSGINPFFNLTPEQFQNAAHVASQLGISKSYFADALTINGPELLGGTIAVLSSVAMARRPEPATLSRIGGGFLVTSLASANPALFPVAAFSLVYAMKGSDRKLDQLKAAGNGALVSGSALAVSSLIGGPVWIGCISAYAVATLVNHTLTRTERIQQSFADLMPQAVTSFQSASDKLTPRV